MVDRIRPDTPTTATERAVYGFDHAQLGGYVARNGTFPPRSWTPSNFITMSTYTRANNANLSDVVAATNYLCSRAGWTSLGVHNVPLPPDSVYRALGLDQVALAVIWEELLPTLEKAASLAAV